MAARGGPLLILFVAFGAAIGAPLRYLADHLVRTRHDSRFPWGTFGVNIVGSLAIGVLAGLSPADGVLAFAGIGLCGALTTYSTFGYETIRLTQEGARLLALLNAVLSVAVGLGAGIGGFALAEAISG